VLEDNGRFEITLGGSGEGLSIAVTGPSSWYLKRPQTGGCLAKLKMNEGTFVFFYHQLLDDLEGE
jgi:hypothetical protein